MKYGLGPTHQQDHYTVPLEAMKIFMLQISQLLPMPLNSMYQNLRTLVLPREFRISSLQCKPLRPQVHMKSQCHQRVSITRSPNRRIIENPHQNRERKMRNSRSHYPLRQHSNQRTIKVIQPKTEELPKMHHPATRARLLRLHHQQQQSSFHHALSGMSVSKSMMPRTGRVEEKRVPTKRSRRPLNREHRNLPESKKVSDIKRNMIQQE
ncbi:hypothetical protein SLS58_010625 [Diplodia intermedia]|uniref:Uncharacterized protein n=1 Tax=Diplodia intermedia TaxID=856260 RepID=A0ABR3T4Z2_9PEZI